MLPKRYGKTIFLAGTHDREKGRNPNTSAPLNARTCAMPGVACNQVGELEEHDDLKEQGKGLTSW